MNPQNLLIIRQRTQTYWRQALPQLKQYTIRFLFLFMLFLLVSDQEISFHIHLGGAAQQAQFLEAVQSPAAQQASLLPSPTKWWQKIKENKTTIKQQLNLANSATATGAALTAAEQQQAAQYSNLGFFLNPTYAANKNIDSKIVAHKLQKCLDYINLYLPTAKEEATLFGIPVAITLAQGLLESNAGDSQLAQNENNHFGIKCKSKCQGCRCANYTDDSQYDMFRIFDSAWYSFREHSNLLVGARYKHLLQLPKTDYSNWAHGLEAAGYATDKQYAEKLIKIIEAFDLHLHDQ